MLKDPSCIQEKVILIAAFGIALIPYILILRKLILIRLDNSLKSFLHYKIFDKNKVLLKVFYCLINLYFLCWNYVVEDSFSLNKWASNLKNLILATSTTITSILLINAFARIAEKSHKQNDSNLILLVQALKILSYGAIIAVATHYIFGVSPYSLITSIGITTGFFVVLFKDAILGLIASVQCTLADSLRIGDQIYLQQYDAEGIVENISPFMIKLRHLDGSTFTVPSHILLTTCIKNFRDQYKKRSRLTKILFNISTDSIKTIEKSSIPNEIQTNQLDQILDFTTNASLFKHYIKTFLATKTEISNLKMLYKENKGSYLPLEVSFLIEFVEDEKYQNLKSSVLEYSFCIANQMNLKFIPAKN
jgi:small-conductance mechanosensitive channel